MKLSLTTPQGFNQPLAFGFFNPTSDSIRRVGPPVPPITTPGLRTERGSGNSHQTAKPIRRSDSLYRRGSFLSLPSLSPFPSLPRFEPCFDAVGFCEPSPAPLARAAGDHGRSARSRPLTAEDIQRELQRRRDSEEELNAQRGTCLLILTSHS